MTRATWMAVACFAGTIAGCDLAMEPTAVAGSALGSPPPAVTVTQRPDGLAVSWTSISVTSYSVLRAGDPIASVNAPTTSYVDAAVSAGVTYCYTVAGVFDDGSATPPSGPACAVAPGAAPATAVISRPKSPALAYNDGSWTATRIVTDSSGRSMVAVTTLSNGVARIELPHEDGERIIGLTALVAGNGAAGANFVVERFGVALPGGLSRLGNPLVDNGRSNVWAALNVPVAPTVLAADDILYLNLSDSTGTSGYSVGGVIPQYDRP